MNEVEYYEKTLSIVQSVMTILGIVVGAIWTYILFVKNREMLPKAEVEHNVGITKVKDDKYAIISLHIKIKNCGKVLLQLNL